MSTRASKRAHELIEEFHKAALEEETASRIYKMGMDLGRLPEHELYLQRGAARAGLNASKRALVTYILALESQLQEVYDAIEVFDGRLGGQKGEEEFSIADAHKRPDEQC